MDTSDDAGTDCPAEADDDDDEDAAAAPSSGSKSPLPPLLHIWNPMALACPGTSSRLPVSALATTMSSKSSVRDSAGTPGVSNVSLCVAFFEAGLRRQATASGSGTECVLTLGSPPGEV